MNDRPIITGNRCVLAVRDLTVSANYYMNNLGFKTLWQGDGWHFLKREEFVVMLGECANERSAFDIGDHSYFAYLDVENIDKLYKEFQSKNLELGKLENNRWGQREFAVKTVDGHRIMFGEEIK